MKQQKFDSTTEILTWAGTKAFAGRLFGTVYIVVRDGLFWYFYRGQDGICSLVMTYEKNLAED